MNNVYLAGHMLNRGSQMQRAAEKEDLVRVNPQLNFYVPQENKSINDKKNLDNNDGLAERIVKHDTDAIFWSDTVVIEPLAEACGTMVELGQLKGMKDVADQVMRILNDPELDDGCKMVVLAAEMKRHQRRRVYPHFEDIRRFKGATESEDRRSWSINQYVYGVCLDVSNGKGLYEWDEVLNELKS